MKIWPNIPRFVVLEAIQRLCDICTAHGTTKPNAQSLSLKSHFLHYIVTYSFIPQGGHRDHVSYLEAFLVDSILVGVNIGHTMLNHMMACC